MSFRISILVQGYCTAFATTPCHALRGSCIKVLDSNKRIRYFKTNVTMGYHNFIAGSTKGESTCHNNKPGLALQSKTQYLISSQTDRCSDFVPVRDYVQSITASENSTLPRSSSPFRSSGSPGATCIAVSRRKS